MMLYKLVSAFDQKRFDNQVVSLTDLGTLGERIQKQGVPVYLLEMSHGVPNPRALWKLIKLLREIRPHILQSWLYHADLLGLVGGSLAGVPSIAWNLRCSDMDMHHYLPLSMLVVRVLTLLSPLPSLIVVNSKIGQKFHIDLGYHPRRWEFIPNGFDLTLFKPDPGARLNLRRSLNLPPDSFLIGHIARYDLMKDHETLITAAHQIIEQHKNVHFVLVGKGVSPENQALAQQVQDAGIEENIHLLGERHDIENIMPALDIATLCSAFGEGFPNVIGEAMACAVPCVATSVGDSAYVIGDTGLIVPPRDPQALAEAWLSILNMTPAERARLGQAGRKRIEQNFSLPLITQQYETLYESLAPASYS